MDPIDETLGLGLFSWLMGIGWTELLLILVIALVVLGPDQLPQVARSLGKLWGEISKAKEDLTGTVQQWTMDSNNFLESEQNQIHAVLEDLKNTAVSPPSLSVARGVPKEEPANVDPIKTEAPVDHS